MITCQVGASTITTKFDTNPSSSGWLVWGNTNLFQWDSTNRNLRVTWDSSQTNSYFYHPLGRTLTPSDGFLVSFDLTVTDVPITNGLQLAIGLLNFADATSTNFFRGSGADSPNVAEFDYFPASGGFAPSLDATLIDPLNTFAFKYDNQALDPGTSYQVVLTHLPGDPFLSGQVFTNGQLYTSLPLFYASGPITDFELDTIAVCSYSDVNAYGSSVLAHGTVDNLTVASPLPVQRLTALSSNTFSLLSDTNWVYTLESSTDLLSWSAAAPATPGNGAILVLHATNAPADKAFYRVRAALP
jgi:hypothetical protein